MTGDRVSVGMEYSNSALERPRSSQMKQFVSYAREFMASHSDKSLSAMNKCLGLIAMSDNISFHPDRLEVGAFFSGLCEVMSHQAGPHWQGVAVLTKAVKNVNAKRVLVEKYRFLPTLSPLLTEYLSFEKKLHLLHLMEELTYHIKINWQESYLMDILKKLTGWILNYDEFDIQKKNLCNLSLTILCNLCYQNLQVTSTLMRTVDTRGLIKKVLSFKGDDSGGIQVCRLLLILQGTQGAPTSCDVHNFVNVTLQAFIQGIKNCDIVQLRHSVSFMDDLCCDAQIKNYVVTYDKYDTAMQEIIKYFPVLLSQARGDKDRSEENIRLENALQFLLILVKIEMYSLKPVYGAICDLCVKSCLIPSCLGLIYSLVASIVSQFQEDGMLPDEVKSVISSEISVLLSPSSGDSFTCGLQWLQMSLSLYECTAIKTMVVAHVQIEQFEDILYNMIQNSSQERSVDSQDVRESVITSCLFCLELAGISSPWKSVLNRMLSNPLVQKALSSCLSASTKERKQALTIIKHSHFPDDKLSQVFCAEFIPELNSCLDVSSNKIKCTSSEPTVFTTLSTTPPVLTLAQEIMLDQTIEKFSQALDNNDIEDITTSNIMELYKYKMCSLEQRLHASMMGLQGATHNVVSLNNSLALLEGINKSQQETVYRTQCQSEKLKENISRLSNQLSEAEQSIKRFQGKLAAERLDREQQMANAKHKHSQIIKEFEAEIEKQNLILNELKEKLSESENNNKNLKNKHAEQVSKNSELAEVLIKFEERVKQRDKKIEETNAHNVNLKNDLHQAQQMTKNLEKTLVERERRLEQLTNQLEQMQKIKDLIDSVMANKSPSEQMS